MNDFLLLGTDTDAGKTTTALLWLAAFGADTDYWKPVETGDFDSERVARLVPGVVVHPPLARFADPVAPLLAARREGRTVPSAQSIISARPRPAHALLIETFGSPFSPLTEETLQLDLVRRLDLPCVVVASSAVGAIGRTLQTVRALAAEGIHPAAVVLVGPRDEFAEEQIRKHAVGVGVFALRPPDVWSVAGIVDAAQRQSETLRSLRDHLSRLPRSSSPLPLYSGGEGSGVRGRSHYSQPDPLTPDPSPPSTGERGEDLLAADRRDVWHPYTSLGSADEPLVVVGAQDEFLHLADGRRVIDGISSWWTIQHGHRDPLLMAALSEASQRWDHVLFAGVTHPPAVELAGLLLRSLGWNGGRVFYSDDGSTAVEVALKMAYQFWCHRGEPQRRLFVGFENGYHGDTFGAMAVGRDPVFFGRFEPLLFRAERVPLSAERLDDVLRRHAAEVAAVIVEPLVQGAGGMRMHTPGELRALADVTRRHGVLFIVDEVMTGGGRTGTLWAHHQAGIVPDLICAGKTLAGGILPLAATMASAEVVAAFETADPERTFFHGHSFTAHPLACAVAAANFRHLLSSDVLAGPRRIEAFWRTQLLPLRDRPGVRDVRICGSIAAIELDVSGGYLATVSRQMRQKCLEYDVFLRPLGNVLYALPPYCTSEASLRRLVDAMADGSSPIRL